MHIEVVAGWGLDFWMGAECISKLVVGWGLDFWMGAECISKTIDEVWAGWGLSVNRESRNV